MEIKMGNTPNEYFSSSGLDKLDAEGRLPQQLVALKGVQQNDVWHPEGDVWVHTKLVVDQAAKINADPIVRLAALCHDLGKPEVTEQIDGKWKSHGHDMASEKPTRDLLEQLDVDSDVIEKVVALVVNHMVPHDLITATAPLKSFRRLSRKLVERGASVEQMSSLIRCDYLGRTNPEAKKGRAPIADKFIIRMQEMLIEDMDRPDPPVVLGRHLIARGFKPGPQFGPILAECHKVQEYIDSIDPEEILKIVLMNLD